MVNWKVRGGSGQRSLSPDGGDKGQSVLVDEIIDIEPRPDDIIIEHSEALNVRQAELAIWFAIHTPFRQVPRLGWIDMPVLSSVNIPAVLLSAGAMIALFRFRIGVLPVLGVCAGIIGAAHILLVWAEGPYEKGRRSSAPPALFI